jgi:Glycosyltransferase WbsX
VNGLVIHGSTPELFREQLRLARARVAHLHGDHQIIFVKSWNEWAEGNHLEPDIRFGRRYLESLRDELISQ